MNYLVGYDKNRDMPACLLQIVTQWVQEIK